MPNASLASMEMPHDTAAGVSTHCRAKADLPPGPSTSLGTTCTHGCAYLCTVLWSPCSPALERSCLLCPGPELWPSPCPNVQLTPSDLYPISCPFLSPLPSHPHCSPSVHILSLFQLYPDPGPISIQSPPMVLMLLPFHLYPVPTPSVAQSLSPSELPSHLHRNLLPILVLIPSSLSLLSASWLQVAPATPWALTPAPVGPSSATVTGTAGSASACPMWRARAVTAAAPTSGTWPVGKAASLVPATPSTP